ncbi:MAG: rhodanese-like domain-containing protein [Cyanobacteria bacterium J06606_4]
MKFRSTIGLLTGLLLCLQLLACSSPPHAGQISAAALATQIEQGIAPLILDVRSAEEYATSHIPGALNINYRDIPNQLNSLQPYANQEIIVYCERGVRASRAEARLGKAGFSHVRQLRGDMSAWRAANLPVEVVTVIESSVSGQ